MKKFACNNPRAVPSAWLVKILSTVNGVALEVTECKGLTIGSLYLRYKGTRGTRNAEGSVGVNPLNEHSSMLGKVVERVGMLKEWSLVFVNNRRTRGR